jgi:predicted enzyme related to lactoylglutathione lyase
MTSPVSRAVEAITLFVDDLAASKAFYGEVLGCEHVFADEASEVFKIGPLHVNLLQIANADELLEPDHPAPSGIRAVYTLGVDSVDDTAATIQARGGALLNGPMNRPWGIRTASIQDPNGHVWEFSGPISE